MRQIQGARDLPWARNRLLRWSEGIDAQYSDVRSQFLHALRLAELYWVTASMTELALDAATDIPEWSMATARPSPSGLIMWAGRLPQVMGTLTTSLGTEHQPIRPAALFWWTEPMGSVRLHLFSRAQTALEAVTQGPDSLWRPGAMELGDMPPLGPVWEANFSMHGDPEPIGKKPPEWKGVTALLGTTWHLMMEPKLTDRSALPQPRKDRDTIERAAGSVSDITIIDLRTLRHVETEAAEPGEGRRHLTVRHYVRGHWRQQYLASTNTHEPRYIAPYIKGPAGAPLVARERVQVWRR